MKLSIVLVSCSVLAALAGTSCSRGGSSAAARPAPTVVVQADRLDGGPGSEFALQAVASDAPTDAQIIWSLGDGREERGPSVRASYAEPGLYEVSTTLLDGGEVLATSALTLTVLDPAGGPTLVGTGIPVPAILGDVDGDGALTVRDVHLVGKRAAGLAPLDDAQRRAADYDLSGAIETLDAQLMARAVANDGVLPSNLAPLAGPRATPVRVVSPALLDVFARAEVQVGSAPARPLRRIHPGYGAFAMPMDAVGDPTLEPITEGPVAVRILVDGVEVETFVFELVNPPPVQGDELDVLAASVDALAQLCSQVEADAAVGLAELGATLEQEEIFRGLLLYSSDQFRAALSELQAAAAAASPREREVLGYFLNASGLRDAQQDLASLADPQPPSAATVGTALRASIATGGLRLRLLCGVDTLLAIAGKIDFALNTACAIAAGAAAVSGFTNGFIGPAVAAAILTGCGAVDVASTVVAVLAEVIPKPTGLLDIQATRVPMTGVGTFQISVSAPFEQGVICGGVGVVVNKVQELLIQRLLRSISAKLSFGVIQNFPFDQRDGGLRQEIVDFVKSAVTFVTTSALDAAGATALIEGLRQDLCNGLVGQAGIQLQIEELDALLVSPASAGTIIAPAPGSGQPALFVCDPAATGPATIVATLLVCGGLGGSTQVDCSAVEVELCQGDNGSLNDDIFELTVVGFPLTVVPSAPTRRICGTISLPPGEYTVRMRGLAAPDQIGTYFISTSVGTLTGPPLTGTNLIRGAVLSWTLRIDPQ